MLYSPEMSMVEKISGWVDYNLIVILSMRVGHWWTIGLAAIPGNGIM